MRLRRVCEQKNANEESRFAGTFAISASFFFIFLIDYCGWVSSRGCGRGRDKMQRSRVFHHRRRLLSVVVDVAWTKRIWIRAKEVFVRENVHGCARSRGRMRVTRSRGGYRFPRTPHKIISLGSDLCFERRICFFFLFSWRGGEDRIIFLSQTFKYYLLQTLTGDYYYYYYYYYRRKLLSSKSLNPRRLSRRLS